MPPSDAKNDSDDAANALAQAVAAFDAANHAFGRYRHFVLSAYPEALAVSGGAVRAALQEAAICVADARVNELLPLRVALGGALDELRRYRERLPTTVPRTELDEAVEDLEESLSLLSGGDEPPA